MVLIVQKIIGREKGTDLKSAQIQKHKFTVLINLNQIKQELKSIVNTAYNSCYQCLTLNMKQIKPEQYSFWGNTHT